MKAMFKLMSCIAMTCLCFQSCADEELVQLPESNHASGELFTLTASQNAPSRLELGQDGMTIKWEPGDQLVLVKKDHSIVPIYMNADLEEPSVTANFVSESPVPAGEYYVVYNYNEHMVYSHHSFASIDDINSSDKMVLWGEVTVKEGDTSAAISLQHLYAKIKVEVKNDPNNYSSYQIGMYASKSGFPIYRQITSSGLTDVDYGYDYYNINNYSYVSIYFPSNRRYHNIRLGNYNAYKYYDEMTGELDTNKEEIEKNSALILPADVSDGTLYFYILNGNECYEIPKSNVKFEPGKSYKVILDMKTATKTTLGTIEKVLPGSTYTTPFYQLTSTAECRHAAYRGYSNCYMLMNDIDFQDDTYLPIKCDYLDGNGKSLKNITIDWAKEDFVGITLDDYYKNEYDNTSGFSYTPIDLYQSRRTVTNITLDDVNIKGNNFVGTLGGSNIKADNCIIKGESSVEGSGNYVGGLIGCNETYFLNYFTISNVTIESCEVKGNNNVGGIIGGYGNVFTYYTTTHSSSIRLFKSCSSAANVTAKEDYAGGIFGKLSGNYVEFSSSDYVLSVSSCVNSGKIEGRNYVGGIGGDFVINGNPNQFAIMQSVSEGNIKGNRDVGGILGACSGSANINVCYSIGEISGSETNVGGIIGSTWMAPVTNSYSLAKLSVGQGGYAGGIIGQCGGGAGSPGTKNCYFAGINPTDCGIIGCSNGYTNVENCLTTLPSLGTNLGNHYQYWNDTNGDGVIDSNDTPTNCPDIITNSLFAVQSILANKNIINSDGAYSDNYWSLTDYPGYCVKFATGLEGDVSAPGFSPDIDI